MHPMSITMALFLRASLCARKTYKLRERANATVARADDDGNAVGDQADLGSADVHLAVPMLGHDIGSGGLPKNQASLALS